MNKLSFTPTTNIWVHFFNRVAAETMRSSKWDVRIRFSSIYRIRSWWMWTQHRINTEKLYFLTRETSNMETEKEDILAIYINLINIINAFTSLQMDFIYKTIARRKNIYEIFCFCSQARQEILWGNALLIYSCIFTLLFALIKNDSRSNRVSSSISFWQMFAFIFCFYQAHFSVEYF